VGICPLEQCDDDNRDRTAGVVNNGLRIDDFLTRVADRLRADRINLAGVLQKNARDDAGACSAMTLINSQNEAAQGNMAQ
jgi:Protein of unknown function (DUF2478)